MKKCYLLFITFFTLVLSSCVNNTLKIENIEKNDNGDYYLEVAYDIDSVNLDDYIVSNSEYTIDFLDETYVSNVDGVIYELTCGENKFTITSNNKSYDLIFYRQLAYNLTILDENNEVVDKKIILEKESINEYIYQIISNLVPNGYEWNNYIYYSTDNVNFDYIKVDEIIESEYLYIKYNFERKNINITLCIDETVKEEQIKIGDIINFVIPTKDNYNFIGWETNGYTVNNGDIYKEEYGTLFNAVWEQVKYNINLETFGGIVDNYAFVENGNIKLPVPLLEGYIFKYWCYDKELTQKVESISLSDYNGETLYAYYEYDSELLKEQYIITKKNKHSVDYDELVLFDNTKSGYTSLYWHKIAVSKINDHYYISNIGKSGDKLSSLGSYDFVILCYSDYPNYSSFVKGDYIIGDEVVFLNDPWLEEDGDSINLMSIIERDICEDYKEIQEYLTELYSQTNELSGDIELIDNYNQYFITWKSSNKDAITSEGKYIKPYTDRMVELCAYINNEEIFKFSILVKGENEKSTALSTGYIYTTYKNITQNAMNMLDIIYCAFLEIDSNGNWTNLTSMTNNINNYIKNKAEIAGTKIVISINQASSGNFSNVAKDASLRDKLATNILNVIKTLGLDGVDIDWETPSSSEASNFTLLMKDIYNKVKAANPEYLVTAAIGGGKWAPPKYDLPNSKNYIDYINLMTYSMASSNGYYQNSLYKSTKGATLVSCSIEESIEIYNDLGVENNQILVGIPFYTTVQTESGGPGSKTGNGKSIWYNQLFTTYKLSDTMKEYYDEECCVPYRYDEVNKIFISFDNERSIQRKCEYINTLGLAGIMYWQYGQDVDDMLSNAIAKYINS